MRVPLRVLAAKRENISAVKRALATRRALVKARAGPLHLSRHRSDGDDAVHALCSIGCVLTVLVLPAGLGPAAFNAQNATTDALTALSPNNHLDPTDPPRPRPRWCTWRAARGCIRSLSESRVYQACGGRTRSNGRCLAGSQRGRAAVDWRGRAFEHRFSTRTVATGRRAVFAYGAAALAAYTPPFSPPSLIATCRNSTMSKTATDRYQRQLLLLLKEPGNDVCADCKARNPRWASWDQGVFLCVQCASMHRKIGSHVTKVKSVTLDKWTKEQVEVSRLISPMFVCPLPFGAVN